jgi:hypothetical protein
MEQFFLFTEYIWGNLIIRICYPVMVMINQALLCTVGIDNTAELIFAPPQKKNVCKYSNTQFKMGDGFCI